MPMGTRLRDGSSLPSTSPFIAAWLVVSSGTAAMLLLFLAALIVVLFARQLLHQEKEFECCLRML